MHLVAQPEALPFELQNHIERTRGRELPFPLRQHFVEKTREGWWDIRSRTGDVLQPC